MADVSIIIETDNVSADDLERTGQLLATLQRQVLEVPDRELELLILHQPSRLSRTSLEALLAPLELGGDSVPPVRLHAVGEEVRYFEMKNRGAQLARGDIVLLLDSDIVPEPGFLTEILAPFSDPEISIVAGSPHVHPRDSLLARASSLYWMFPLRAPGGPLERTTNMYANTLAIRREVLLAHPFPELDGYRAQTYMLARRLHQAGIAIWRSPNARTQHPPPANLWAAARRALWEGHDRFVDRPVARQRPATPARAARGLAESMAGQWRRFVRQWQDAGLRPHELPAAWAIAFGFEVLVRVGFLMSVRDRTLLARLLGRT